MKIKSPFRDYYDFVAHQYGGGDPAVVYVRDRIGPIVVEESKYYHGKLTTEPSLDMPKELEQRFNFVWRHLESEVTEDGVKRPVEHKMVIVMGCLFIARRVGVYEKSVTGYSTFSNFDNAPWVMSPRGEEIGRRKRYAMPPVIVLGEEDPDCVKLSQHIGHPVFVLDSAGRSVSPRCPNLGELGMGSVIDPYTLYQELSMFVGGRMQANPDMMPAVPQSDLMKVDSHGFDRKQSFRHRK